MWYALGAVASLGMLPRLVQRIELSRAKHRSLAGHARISRRIAKLVPFYEYQGDAFFCADDAPDDVAAIRRAAFARLSALYASRFARSAALTAESLDAVSDLQFT